MPQPNTNLNHNTNPSTHYKLKLHERKRIERYSENQHCKSIYVKPKKSIWARHNPKNILTGPKKAQNNPKQAKNKKSQITKNVIKWRLSVYLSAPQHFFRPYSKPKITQPIRPEELKIIQILHKTKENKTSLGWAGPSSARTWA